MSELAKTDAAQHEIAENRSGAATPGAARVRSGREFLARSLLLFDQRLLRHRLLSSSS